MAEFVPPASDRLPFTPPAGDALTGAPDVHVKFQRDPYSLNDDEWAQLYRAKKNQSLEDQAAAVVGGAWEAGKHTATLPLRLGQDYLQANKEFADTIKNNPTLPGAGEALANYGGRAASSLVEGTAQAFQMIPEMAQKRLDSLRRAWVSPARGAVETALSVLPFHVPGAEKALDAVMPQTSEEERALLRQFKENYLRDYERAKIGTSAPPELLQGFKPLPAVSEAYGLAAALPAWEIGAEALGMRAAKTGVSVVDQALSKMPKAAAGATPPVVRDAAYLAQVEERLAELAGSAPTAETKAEIARLSQLRTVLADELKQPPLPRAVPAEPVSVPTAGETALRKTGEVSEAVGGTARKIGAFPRNVLEKLIGAVTGPEYADRVAKVVEGASLFHSPVVKAIAALEGVGAGIEKAGQLFQHLSRVNGVFGRFAALAKDPTAPAWMRRLVSMPISKAAVTAADLTGHLAKGAAEGAVTGLGFAAAGGDAEDPEALGAGVGGMAMFGLGARALSLPWVRKMKMGEVTRQKALDLVIRNLRDGATPEALTQVSDWGFATAAVAESLFPDYKVQFLDPAAFDQRVRHIGGEGAAGYTSFAPGDKTIYVSTDAFRRLPETTLLHEIFHPAWKSEVANRPELRSTVDGLLKRHGLDIQTAKTNYIRRLLAPQHKLETAEDFVAFEKAVADQVTAFDQTAGPGEVQPGDWIYSEILNEGAMRALWGKNLADVANPSLYGKVKEKLGLGKKPNVVDATVLGEELLPVLDDPTMGQMVRGLLRRQKDFRPGLDKSAAQEAPLTERDMGSAKAPFYPTGDGRAINPYGLQVDDGKGGKKFVPFTSRQRRQMARAEKRALARYIKPGQRATAFPPEFYKDPDIGPWTKEAARQIEAAMAGNKALEGHYHRLNARNSAETGDWKSDVARALGNTVVSWQEFQPLAVFQSKAGNVLTDVFSLAAFKQKAAMWAARTGDLSLEMWGGDVTKFAADVNRYNQNHAAGLPGDANNIGSKKRDVINAFLFGRNAQFQENNPLRKGLHGADRQGIVRALRLDRLETLQPHETDMAKPNYEFGVKNFSPSDDPRAVKLAAVRERETGKIYEGPMHAMAAAQYWAERFPDAPEHVLRAWHSTPELEEGFTTNSGEFLTREQAFQRAQELNQYKPTFQDDNRLESTRFAHQQELIRQGYKPDAYFSPAEKRIVEVEGPDGKKYKMRLDGYQDFSIMGWGMVPQLTAMEEIPGVVGLHSTTYSRGLEKKGFKMPEGLDAPEQAAQSVVEAARNEPRPFSPAAALTKDKTLPYAVGPGSLRLVHFSSRPGLKNINPRYFGKGRAQTNDLRGGNKSYFFVEGSPMGGDADIFGRGGYVAYSAEVDTSKLYDLRYNRPDPLGYFTQPNREKADDTVRRAGYHGILIETGKSDGRKVVQLYRATPVKEVGAFKGTKAKLPKEFSPSAGFEDPQVRDQVPPLVQEEIRGGLVTKPAPSYHEATQTGGNPWVRRSANAANSAAPTNENRLLMVQFSSDLISKAHKDQASDYYDKLYSGARPGYARLDDFWEIPQWMGFVAHTFPDADVYVVRDMEQAKRFLKEAGYGRVAFSALDVNKHLIRDLAADYGGKVDVGGYVEKGTFDDLANVKYHPTVESLAKDAGVEFRDGVDYRHFAGSDVIPRLTMSTGCRHKCAFCSVTKTLGITPREVIEQQADAIAGLGSKLVYLNDKTFGQAGNYKMLSDIYTRIKSQVPDFKGFVVQTTAAQLKLMPVDWLKKSGIKFVELGVETYNDPLLKEMRKPATESMIDQVTNKLRQSGIILIPNIIIGLPGETPQTYQHTLNWLRNNRDVISHANIYNLAVYKDAELGKKLATASEDDFNENVLEKSWHVDPKVHQVFAGEVYGLASEMLDNNFAYSPSARRGEPLPDLPGEPPKTAEEFLSRVPLAAVNGPARLDAFRNPETLPAALKMPGWAVLTGTVEKRGSWDAPENVQANAALKAELEKQFGNVQEVRGSYKGVDQGPNFLVHGITPEQASEIGTRFGQESVLVPQGLLYQDNTLTPVDHSKNIFDPEARKQEFFSQIPDGPAFSLGLDFEKRIPAGQGPEAFSPRKREEVSASPFYSRLTRALESLPAGETKPKTGQQWLGWIDRMSRGEAIPTQGKNTWRQGIANEEIKEVGLDKLLVRGRQYTRQQVLDLVKANAPVLEETVYPFPKPPKPTKAEFKAWDMEVSRVLQEHRTPEQQALADKIQAWANYQGGQQAKETRYEEYTLPGGKNYQEILFRYPQSAEARAMQASIQEMQREAEARLQASPEYAELRKKLAEAGRMAALWDDHPDLNRPAPGYETPDNFERWFYDQPWVRGRMMDEKKNDPKTRQLFYQWSWRGYREFLGLQKQALREKLVGDLQARIAHGERTLENAHFTTGHWDDRDVLAHTRVKDRTDTQGNKRLFIEEIQSDWHQQGRKQGYRSEQKDQETLNKAYQAEMEKVKAAGYTVEDSRGFGTTKYISNPNGVIVGGLSLDMRETSADDPKLQPLIDAWKAAVENRQVSRSAPPDAPWRKTWPEMVFRRLVRKAAEEGKKWIGWTTGRQQGERYDLSKQVSKVSFAPEDYLTWDEGSLHAYDHNGKQVIHERGLTPEQLEEYIGKDPAKKLLEQIEEKKRQASEWSINYHEGDDNFFITDPSGEQAFEWGGTPAIYDSAPLARAALHDILETTNDADATISGLDLSVGGEGMKGFYDKMLVDYANKFAKKYGAKVEARKIENPEDFTTESFADWMKREGDQINGLTMQELQSLYYEKRNRVAPPGLEVHSLTITPEMRKAVLSEGVPMFSPAAIESKELKPPTEALAEPRFVSGWMAPGGEFYPLGKIATHENWALKALRVSARDLDDYNLQVRPQSPGSTELYRRGWLRVVPYGSDSIMSNSVAGRAPSTKQQAALKDMGVVVGANRWYHDNGNSYRVLWSTADDGGPAFSPANQETMAFGDKKEPEFANVGSMTVQEIAQRFPEAVIAKARDEKLDYGILDAPLIKGLPEDQAVKLYADKLHAATQEWKDNPVFQSGLRWYSEFVPMLKKTFGKHAGLMAQLLAATSPRANPTVNFAFALDALELFKRGHFKPQIAKFEQGLKMLENGTLERWYNARVKKGLVENPPKSAGQGTWLAHWCDAHDLYPRQSNGQLYGMRSAAVLDVLVGRWLETNEGLKVSNFVKNLMGVGHEATVDVWAARLMRRLGYEGLKERWRLLPMNETGISDPDFLFSQKVFREAATRMGVKPDALQGAMWFAEKQLWHDKGWSPLDLGDFRREIKKTDMLRAGVEQRLAAQTRVQKAAQKPATVQASLFGP